MPLEEYQRKRKFSATPEPPGEDAEPRAQRQFVVQHHAARRTHYDLRLEIDGVLKSWAVPKGPSFDPKEKRLAVMVEDHPLEYVDFEGVIPKGQYGAGAMIVWDQGIWSPEIDPLEAIAAGEMKFTLEGRKLVGKWVLVKLRTGENEWLWIKEKDDFARPMSAGDVLAEAPESTKSARTVEEVAASGAGRHSAHAGKNAPWRKTLLTTKGGKTAPIPDFVEPQRPQLSQHIPHGKGWIHEIKHDGFRLMARLAGGDVRLLTRRGHDWTHRYPETAGAFESVPATSAIIDGEIVALSPDGVSHLTLFQTACRENRTGKLVFFAFDLLYLDGVDLRECKLKDRKRLLAQVVAATASTRIQFVEHLEGDGKRFYDECRRIGVEGIVSKKIDRPYRSGKNDDWSKRKGVTDDEFVVGGFTPPKQMHSGIGALLVGRFNEDGKLVFCGRVGSGLAESDVAELSPLFKDLASEENPFVAVPRDKENRRAKWVKPEVVVTVQYAEFSESGMFRHPTYRGTREDVSAGDLFVLDSNQPAEPSAEDAPQAGLHSLLTEELVEQLGNLRLTTPGRVLFPDAGITKLDLATYMTAIGERMLAYVHNRPISLFRCPDGLAGDCFFQKHGSTGLPEHVDRIKVPSSKGKPEGLVVRTIAGLVSLAQMNVIEVHAWGALADMIERPDRVVFDLDPDDSVAWGAISTCALRLREILGDAGLECFVKTTGGKGLHVVVPIRRRHDWSTVENFSKRVCKALSTANKDDYTLSMNKEARRGKIYLDFRRNIRGATAAAPYSTRALPGAPIALPIFWEELGDQRPIFRLPEVADRLSTTDDPWEAMPGTQQSLSAKVLAKIG